MNGSVRNINSLSAAEKWVFLLFSISVILVSQHSLLFLVGMILLFFLTHFFFNKSVPPVLFLSGLMGWFFFQGQLIDGLFDANAVVTDQTIVKRYDVLVIGFVGVFFFFLGIYLPSRKIKLISFDELRTFFLKINLNRLLWLYLTIYVGLFFLGSFIWWYPGLSQPFFALAQFRWSVFFLLFVSVLIQDRFKFILLLLIILDVGLSLFSFFSTFKEVIYFSFLSYWIFFFRGSVFARAVTTIIVIATFYVGVYWTAVKADYRDFLNNGTGVQAVRVSRSEAYSKLVELVTKVNPTDFDRGVDDLVTRLSWVGAFDAVYKYVPSKVPFQEGGLWWEGVTRPFLPRLFFPDKKILTDSKELNYYSGLGVEEKNTSISLSMMAGSYVDFGKYGMHVPLFLFGLFCGWVYRKAMKWGQQPVVGYALSMPMIYLLNINEQSINRVISAMVLYLLVLWFIKRFLLSPIIRFILVR